MKKLIPSTQRGQALILIALAAVGLFGIAALAIDGSAKFSDRRHAQNAADTAALAGAIAMARADPHWELEALNRALENGYDDNHLSNEVEVYNPPTTGVYSNCSDVHFDCNDYVEVIITSHVDTFFARVIGIYQTHNRVEAVASKISANNSFNFGGNAVVALSPEGCALKAAGSTDVTINGGGMYSNSDATCAFHQQTCAGSLDVNNADGSQGDITMVGSDHTGSCPPQANMVDNGAIQLRFPPPYQEIAEPSVCSDSLTSAPSGTTVTLSPGHYSAMPPRNNIKNTTLMPGVYCIDTTLRANSGDVLTVSGTFAASPGVFLYFRSGGSFTINGGATINLWGINDIHDPYYGFLMYVAPNYASDTQPNCTINGGSTSGYEGMIYAPYCNLKINGNSGMVMESQLVGFTVDLSGASGITLNYDANSSPVWNIPLQVSLSK